jgi:chromosome segregation ATPase
VNLHKEIDAEKKRAENEHVKDKDALNSELLRVTSRREGMSREHSELNGKITQAKRMRDSKFRAYPGNMESLVMDIQAAERRGTWRGASPIGPMGMFIEVTDTRYGNVIESLLNNTVNCFCVDNDADLNGLRRMIEKHRLSRNVSVIKLSNRDIDAQFRGDQPDDRLDTVFRSVKVRCLFDLFMKRLRILAC